MRPLSLYIISATEREIERARLYGDQNKMCARAQRFSFLYYLTRTPRPEEMRRVVLLLLLLILLLYFYYYYVSLLYSNTSVYMFTRNLFVA